MKIKSIPSPWLYAAGNRLDCGPYFSGGLEARLILEGLDCEKARLCDLTSGHKGGIFNGPKFSRTWVTDPKHGVPFLGSASMLRADLSDLPFLRNKDAYSNKLSYLRIEPGMSLISCSGTIGRMVYARPDMAGMWSSQHIMKVVADDSKILPGYLYAFLSSKFGIPQVMTGVHGAIIQTLQPENIADVLVPRLGDRIERQVHDLVQQAAEKRSIAVSMIENTERVLIKTLQLKPLGKKYVWDFSIQAVNASELRRRFDGKFHSEAAIEAETQVRNCACAAQLLKDVTDQLFKPPMFKRLWVDDERYGYRFASGIDLYQLRGREDRFVSRKTPNLEEFLVHEGSVIFQAAGSINGLFGRPIFVSGWMDKVFCADDMYRIVPRTTEDGGYIFAFLRTEHGQVLLKRQAAGHAIPRVWDPQMNTFEIPWPDKELRTEIGAEVILAHQLRQEGLEAELQAIRLVEESIAKLGAD